MTHPIIALLTQLGPGPIEELPDGNRTDLHLCYMCSSHMSMPGVPRKIFHDYPKPDELSGGHHAFYGHNLTVAQQSEIYEWEERMCKSQLVEMRLFLDKRQFEGRLGIRDPDVKPMSIISLRADGKSPTFEEISLRTDMCDYPMFPEEIRDWVEAHRTTYPIRDESVLDIIHDPYGYTFRDTFCQTEIILFTLWLQSKHLGAGSQFFTGRLRETDKYDIVSEEEIEAQWNKME